MLANQSVVIGDLSADAQFSVNPLVTGPMHLRFYAGVPLRSLNGIALGTLCIADTQSRSLSPAEVANLHDFAAWAERELTMDQLAHVVQQRKAFESELREREVQNAAVIASLAEGVVFHQSDGTIAMCNASAERILGLSAAQMMGLTSIDPRWRSVHEDGTPFPGEEHPSMVALRTGQPVEHVMMGVHKPDGSLTWILINAHPLVHASAERPYAVVTSYFDMTHQKAIEQQLTAYQQQLETHNAALTILAATDAMTGVANKRALLARLEVEVRLAQQTQSTLSLLLIDIDYFKAYNDCFGHPAGDSILTQFARLLSQTARTSDLVARYGGEEFVVILPSTTNEGAYNLAERFRNAVEQTPFPYRVVTTSIGVTTSTGGAHSAEELIAAADAALYAAKDQGRNVVVAAALD